MEQYLEILTYRNIGFEAFVVILKVNLLGEKLSLNR